MLKVNDLTFAYKKNRKSHPVFDNLSVTFGKGFNVILGPNGSGKSTLLKAIFGLLNYSGSIFYGQDNFTTMAVEDKTKIMSYLPQMDMNVSTLTVLEMVILGRLPDLGHKIKDEDLNIVMDTLESLNIASLASRNCSELSGGQQKLVFIAQTLVRKPELILLDEPVNSLDLQKQLELCQLLQNIVNKQNVDLLVVLHDINLASRYAQHIVIVNDRGQIYNSGSSKEVITPLMLEEVYGVKAKVAYDDHDGIPVVAPICSIR